MYGGKEKEVNAVGTIQNKIIHQYRRPHRIIRKNIGDRSRNVFFIQHLLSALYTNKHALMRYS